MYNLCGYSRGFARQGASNESEVIVNGDFRFFRSLYLLNLHIKGHNYYIVLCSPLVAFHWHQNGWPWMTLNGHFAIKSGPSSASNGLAFWLSAKTVRKFAELCIYCQRQQKCSPATVLVISVMGLFIGVTRRWSVKPVDCIHTHSSHTCCSLMPVENK